MIYQPIKTKTAVQEHLLPANVEPNLSDIDSTKQINLGAA